MSNHTQNGESSPTAPSKTMRTFFIIWIGQVISILGSRLTFFALGVWIYSETGKATPFVLTALFGSLPGVLLAPLAGSWADRYNRRWIMILADSGDAILTGITAMLLFTNNLQIWHIYIISGLGSTLSVFQEPAFNASVTMLVPRKDLGRANGILQLGQALTSILTPIIAGALFAFIGLKGIILIDLVSFVFAIGALMIVRIPQPKLKEVDQEKSGSTVIKDFKFGWNYLRTRPGLFGMLWYFAMVNFFLNFSGVLLGPMVLSFSGPAQFGIVQSILGVGLLLGSLLMSAWGGGNKRIPVLISTIALAGVGISISGLKPSTLVIGLGMSILMFFVPIAGGSSQAIFMAKVAPDIQGRVFSIRRMIATSMGPLAYVLCIFLADDVFEPLLLNNGALANTLVGNILGTGPGRGIGLMFVIAGILIVVASVFAWLNPRIRNVQEELPDATIEVASEFEGDPEAVPAA